MTTPTDPRVEAVAQGLFAFGISEMHDPEGVRDWDKLPEARRNYWRNAACAAIAAMDAHQPLTHDLAADIIELIERLREGVFGTDETKTDEVLHSYMQRAADALAAKDAEIARQSVSGERELALLARLRTLEAALVRLHDCDLVITPLDRMDAVRDIARAALEGQEP